MKKLLSIMSNLQTYYHFKLDFLEVDQYTADKWLIRGTKQRKGNPLHSLVGYPSREFTHDIKVSEGNMFNPMSRGVNTRELRICRNRTT